MNAERPVRVGIGVVGRADRYLVRRRPLGGPLAGIWEFPGGKCVPGEPPATAASRECREEIGLDVAVGSLLLQTTYRYPHAWVELSFFECSLEDPAAQPDPDTGFEWVAVEDLPALGFPAANEGILNELLRRHGCRTGPRPASGRTDE